jgi:protein O-GlcNAc transferase
VSIPATQRTRETAAAASPPPSSSSPTAASSSARKWSRAGRRLRVGLVSSDFRAHPTARFLEPVMEGRQRDAMEIYCYSDVSRPDAVTARLKHRADAWRDAAGVGDGELAGQIRRDGVDVLVDLNGHMPGHRLVVFARRAAPVQVSAIGYPGTTGLETMDYRLTDGHHDPLGGDQLGPELVASCLEQFSGW